MPLNVIIVGAGIAGLSAGIGLVRHGHQVTIYERRAPSNRENSGSSIQLQPNVAQTLDSWGLDPALRKAAHDNELADLRLYDGGSIAKLDYRPKGPALFALRRVVKEVFRDHAIKQGIERVDSASPAAVLSDGRTITADLIIGADGSNSRVRKTLFPEFAPKVLNQGVFQVLLPLTAVQQDQVMRELLDQHHVVITVAPGRSIFASPAPHQNLMEMQFLDHEYSLHGDPYPSKHNLKIHGLVWLRERYSDFSPAVQKFLATADEMFKWRRMEVKGVPAWSSTNGKVVLLGDAVHAMTPYAGQGSAMCIETPPSYLNS